MTSGIKVFYRNLKLLFISFFLRPEIKSGFENQAEKALFYDLVVKNAQILSCECSFQIRFLFRNGGSKCLSPEKLYFIICYKFLKGLTWTNFVLDIEKHHTAYFKYSVFILIIREKTLIATNLRSVACQFLQHFTSSFFANILAPKNYKAKL